MYLCGSSIANFCGIYIVVIASYLLCNVVCCTEISVILSKKAPLLTERVEDTQLSYK